RPVEAARRGEAAFPAGGDGGGALMPLSGWLGKFPQIEPVETGNFLDRPAHITTLSCACTPLHLSACTGTTRRCNTKSELAAGCRLPAAALLLLQHRLLQLLFGIVVDRLGLFLLVLIQVGEVV